MLAVLLVDNCYLPDRLEKYGKKSFGIRDQVPWGKHSPVSYRLNNRAKVGAKNVNQTNFFPAVLIKDPYTWMDSMCRHPYEAYWKELNGHCPNLVPTTVQEERALKGAASFKVQVRYSKERIYYDSLAHLWNEWYNDWIDAEFPRLIIRFEDLVFHTESVVTQVCKCAGGNLKNDRFKYTTGSAKGNKGVHKGGNGLVKSVQKYGSVANRVRSFQDKDLEYAKDHLRSDIMDMFHYNKP